MLTALFDKFQGKTGQGRSAANFLLAQERQYRKEAVSAHGVGRQSNHPWYSDEDSEASDALGGTVDATDRAAMRVLAKNRSVHGTTECKLTKATRRAETAPGWAGMGADHAAWVQALHQDQSTPDAAIVDKIPKRVYLAIMNGAKHFSVLHHLHRWKAAKGGCSCIDGCIVAFEGEVRDAYGLPLLWRFDEREEGLLHLCQLQRPALHWAALFYRDGKNDGRFHNRRIPPPLEWLRDTINMCSHLISIPVGWAHLFLDYPSLGVAFWRSTQLISHAKVSERHLLWPFCEWVALACCLLDPVAMKPISTLNSKWKRVAYTKSLLSAMTAAWEGHSPAVRYPPPPRHQSREPTHLDSNVGMPARQSASTRKSPPELNRRRSSAHGTRGAQTPMVPAPVPVPAGLDVVRLITTLLQAQLEAQLA